MVRIVNRSQSGNRREWLQELENQKREMQERRQKEKLEAMASYSSDITLMDSAKDFREFGGRRRHINDIIKLEQASLPSTTQNSTQETVQKKKERIPFSGAVKTHEPNYHRTRSFLNEPETQNNLNLEWKIALEKQIQEKKERIAREKEYDRQLELREISRFENSAIQVKRMPVIEQVSEKKRDETISESKRERIIGTEFKSKLPKLKYFAPKTPPKLEDILPSISKFSSLIGRTSQLSFTNSKRCPLSVKNPPPVLIDLKKQEQQRVRKPVKIVQKFPVRTTELSTPPSLGRRSWPAGVKAFHLHLQEPQESLHATNLEFESPLNSKSKHPNNPKNASTSSKGLNNTITKSKESETIDLDESLERRRAIKELQSLWSEYEHEKRTEIT